MVLFVILLQRFICIEVIQIGKTYLINRIYQIIIISILKNWSYKYFNYYFIKFIGFITIYYVINIDIISSYMIFNYLYLDLSIYYKFESIISLTFF